MNGSLASEALSSVALLGFIFGPLAWYQRREIRAWCQDIRRDVFGPLP